MVQKRQLAEEEYDASPKHLKLENSCQLVSCLEFPSKEIPLKSCISGITEGSFFKETSGSECRFESGKIMDPPVCTEKDVGYSHLLRYPPLKEVPIGREYQAVIPEWCGFDANNASFRSGSSKTSAFCEANSIYDDENKFMGSCVVSIHEADGTVCNDDDSVGKGRTNCCCEDPDSSRCVRQHIREAREKIRRNIGHERFLELGFCSMGDVVACKWTEEDERLFHEVVYSNPVSLGKNFWVHLAEAFPSRTNREIVSYYFNVFVLQRRAEQNRCDPMNADSDDDEWQGSDQDEDLCRDEIGKYGYSIGNPVFDYNEDMGFLHGFRGSINFSESGGDCDFQDDSCTSSDTGVEPEASEVKVDCGKLWSNHDFILEPLDSKGWDVGCFSFPRNKTDFLSTGSMIEEVFGVESWNITVKDNKKSS